MEDKREDGREGRPSKMGNYSSLGTSMLLSWSHTRPLTSCSTSPYPLHISLSYLVIGFLHVQMQASGQKPSSRSALPLYQARLA
jgi:hypothetical protein